MVNAAQIASFDESARHVSASSMDDTGHNSSSHVIVLMTAKMSAATWSRSLRLFGCVAGRA